MIIKTLKSTRILQDLTQRELADMTGLTPATISFIENSVHYPQEATKGKIEQALGQKIDWERTWSDGIHRQAIRN